MARFFDIQRESIDRARMSLAGDVAEIRSRLLDAADAAEIGSKVAPALVTIYSAKPDAKTPPPPCFAVLVNAVLENANGKPAMDAGMAPIEAVEKRCIAMLTEKYPALSRLDLGADDLMLVVYEANLVREGLRAQAKSLAADNAGSSGFMERVKDKLRKPEIARLEEEATEYDLSRQPTARALVNVLLRAAKSREMGQFTPLDPSLRSGWSEKMTSPHTSWSSAADKARAGRSEAVIVPPPAQLLAAASLMSERYPTGGLSILRGLIENDGPEAATSDEAEHDDRSRAETPTFGRRR